MGERAKRGKENGTARRGGRAERKVPHGMLTRTPALRIQAYLAVARSCDELQNGRDVAEECNPVRSGASRREPRSPCTLHPRCIICTVRGARWEDPSNPRPIDGTSSTARSTFPFQIHKATVRARVPRANYNVRASLRRPRSRVCPRGEDSPAI